MIYKNFDAIEKADIDELIENKVNESKTLEYKQQLPGMADKDKKEFLHDVSAFANASGGDIIYGIKEDMPKNGNKTAAPKCVMPITCKTADKAKGWLEDVIRNGLRPRLHVQIKEIVGWGNGDGFVILIRIPNSLASPHMVILGGKSRFSSRDSSGKHPLDVDEIRSAFLATEHQGERIKHFREDRLGRIVADETPVRLSSPHRLVLHVIPITSFLNNERMELQGQDFPRHLFSPIRNTVSDKRYNVDGFLTPSISFRVTGGPVGYCQLFFDGSIEAVDSDVLEPPSGEIDGDSPGSIVSISFEETLIEAVASYLKGYRQIGLSAPVAISLALLGCKGAVMHSNSLMFPDYSHPIDRDAVILPDIVIDKTDIAAELALKPIFDGVWNTCGYSRCMHYDRMGNWKAPRY